MGKEILGKTGPNKHSHILAIEQLNGNKPVTAKIINEILAHYNISITDETTAMNQNVICKAKYIYKPNQTDPKGSVG